MSIREKAISMEFQIWIDEANRAIVCRQVDNVSNNVNNIERIEIQSGSCLGVIGTNDGRFLGCRGDRREKFNC